MYPLFETICIENGQILNGHYHELRFMQSFVTHYGKKPAYLLFDQLILPDLANSLKYKLRVNYNDTGTNWTVSEYRNTIPVSLRLVCDDAATYHLKYAERKHLNRLYIKRGNADDVLIIKNGFVTDATYSNILFTDGLKIVTPATPLLEGTCRARLLNENKIQEKLILADTILRYPSFQLINAMNDFDENRWISTQKIIK